MRAILGRRSGDEDDVNDGMSTGAALERRALEYQSACAGLKIWIIGPSNHCLMARLVGTSIDLHKHIDLHQPHVWISRTRSCQSIDSGHSTHSNRS